MERVIPENSKVDTAMGKEPTTLVTVPGYREHGKTTTCQEMPLFTMQNNNGLTRELFAEHPEKVTER